MVVRLSKMKKPVAQSFKGTHRVKYGSARKQANDVKVKREFRHEYPLNRSEACRLGYLARMERLKQAGKRSGKKA